MVSVTGDASRRVSYGELVDGRLLGVAIPVKGKGAGFGLELGGARPKAASEYTIVGRSVPRVDIPPKVTGEHFYIQDVRVPGMLHGRVIRPTGLGSQLLSHGKPSHGARVVRRKNFLGVVAEREWDAIQAAQELEVQWSDWAGLPPMDELYSYIRETPSLEDTVVASTGDAAKALADASRAVRGLLHDRGADARLDRPLLRGRRRQGRLGHGLVGNAGAERRARGGRRRPRHPGREGTRHHLRGLGLLRPERVRPGHDRRGADVAAHGPPGPRAVDAP